MDSQEADALKSPEKGKIILISESRQLLALYCIWGRGIKAVCGEEVYFPNLLAAWMPHATMCNAVLFVLA